MRAVFSGYGSPKPVFVLTTVYSAKKKKQKKKKRKTALSLAVA